MDGLDGPSCLSREAAGERRCTYLKWAPEVLLSLSVVGAAVLMPSLLLRAILLPERERWYSFEAKGVVEEFGPTKDGSYRITVWGHNRGLAILGSVSTVNELLQYAPSDLKVGATFDKAPGTTTCMINGEEYELWPFAIKAAHY